MAYSTTAKNSMLDSLGSTFFVSAHTADPGDTGASEVTGGAYARQSISFALASAGSRDSTVQPSIPIPGGTTVTHTGLWDSLSGGTFLGSFALGGAETFGSDGNLQVLDMDLLITDS